MSTPITGGAIADDDVAILATVAKIKELHATALRLDDLEVALPPPWLNHLPIRHYRREYKTSKNR